MNGRKVLELLAEQVTATLVIPEVPDSCHRDPIVLNFEYRYQGKLLGSLLACERRNVD